MTTGHMTFRPGPELMERIDAARGEKSRNAFIRDIIIKELAPPQAATSGRPFKIGPRKPRTGPIEKSAARPQRRNPRPQRTGRP